MKNFKEFLSEAHINADGELTDFKWWEEGNYDPAGEEIVDNDGGNNNAPPLDWGDGGDDEDNLDKDNLEVKINNNEDFLDFDRILPMFRVRGLKIISFWYINGGMVDREMLGIFPEFNLPHFYEGGSEGSLEYDGRMTIPQLEQFFYTTRISSISRAMSRNKTI